MNPLALITGGTLTTKLIAGAVALAALGAAYWGWHHHVYTKGYNAAIHDIAAKDKRAVDAANELGNRIDQCNGTVGMRWSTEAGECVRR